MKKILFYLVALTAVFALGGCSDDDSPVLSGVESGDLKLDVDAINGNNSSYTFTWTNARFFIDGDMQRQVSLVGYEKNGIDYHLMGVETGRSMDEAVDFGSVVSSNHLTLSYEEIASIMMKNFGMERSADEESSTSIDFQLVAKYSNPDDCFVKSSVLTVPFVLTVTPPMEGEKYKLFISIDTDWPNDPYVYAWTSGVADTALFGSWGGYAITGSTVAGPDGNQYYEIPLNDKFYGPDINLIIHNEVESAEDMRALYTVNFANADEDVYIRVTGNYLDGYKATLVKKPLPKLYVKSDLGWSEYAMYVWPEDDVLPEWPGILSVGTETINGEQWIVFEPTKPYTQKSTNWIINNNNNGQQFDLMQGYSFTGNTFVRVAADGKFTVAGGPIVSEGYVVYVDDQIGWNLTLYQWGEVNNFGGDWPGKSVDGTVTISGTTYKYFNFGADVKGLSQNLIFSDNGSNQLGDFPFTFTRDIYLTVTKDGVTEK